MSCHESRADHKRYGSNCTVVAANGHIHLLSKAGTAAATSPCLEELSAVIHMDC